MHSIMIDLLRIINGKGYTICWYKTTNNAPTWSGRCMINVSIDNRKEDIKWTSETIPQMIDQIKEWMDKKGYAI